MALLHSDKSPKKAKQYFSEMLIYFLQHGYLPAWSDVTSKKAFIEKLMEWAKKDINLATKRRLVKVLHEKDAQQRIIHHLSDVFFYLFIEEIFPYSYNLIVSFQQDMEQLLEHKSPEERKEISELFKIVLLQHLEINDNGDTAAKVARFFIEQLHQQKYFSIGEFKQFEFNSPVLSEETKNFINAKDNFLKFNEHNPPTEQMTLFGNDVESSFNISNAGLILLAPFLSPLFVRLNMLETDKLVDKEAATCIIHYLLTGDEDVAEFELVLPKVLCGTDLPELVNVALPLNKAQKVEANELLLSVIEYWGILKNTSMESLRESFLQRNGKLSFTNDEWLLEVEQKPFDVLLQKLPWSIDAVQLPWMKHQLKTKWAS